MNLMNNFRREIAMGYELNDRGQIVVRTTMQDPFHDIRLTAVVNYATMAVEDINVEFVRAPVCNCPYAGRALTPLVGLVIGPGLTKRLFSALGGSTGCPNLRNMLLCALPLAINVKAAEGYATLEEMHEGIHRQLRNSCAGYSDAPS